MFEQRIVRNTNICGVLCILYLRFTAGKENERVMNAEPLNGNTRRIVLLFIVKNVLFSEQQVPSILLLGKCLRWKNLTQQVCSLSFIALLKLRLLCTLRIMVIRHWSSEDVEGWSWYVRSRETLAIEWSVLIPQQLVMKFLCFWQ
jgi:hypothetical protein